MLPANRESRGVRLAWKGPNMILIHCDRCEQKLTFGDEFAGQKVECPHCGDMNKLPASGEAAPTSSAAPDRAAAHGLPPDDGPETRVITVRPSLIRSRPFLAAALGLAPLALMIALWIMIPSDKRPVWVLVALPALGWLVLGSWALFVRISTSLEITNKRTVIHEGLLSRSTSEVLHDHVRNIEIDQSFINRVCRVGKIGISSSGQDGIEVECEHIPDPRRLKEVIDLYRPL